MNTSDKETNAYYKDAIIKLRRYIAVEDDEENCEEAAAKIKQYRFKIIDESFNEIIHRTKRLTTLMHDLMAVITNASNTQTVSDAISELNGMVSEISNIVNPQE